MKRRITGSYITTKLFIFSVLAIFSFNVHAEYYLVYPGPHLVCQSHCGVKVYKRVHKRPCYYPVRKHRYHVKRHVRRVYPCYRGCAYRVPACRVYRPACGCMTRVVCRPRCGGCGGYGYPEPIDASNIYPDMATGDDNPNFDPELNIDR